MWIRRELKERAKAVLRGNYWKAFLISLVIILAGGSGGSGGNGGSSSRMNGEDGWGRAKDIFGNIGGAEMIAATVVIVIVILLVCLIALALRIFLGYPLEVGGRRYFVQSSRYADNRWCFRFAFDSRHYMGIVGSMLLKGIQNFLWFLLFVIPGIVKGYAYSMVPYILSENPNVGAKRAIKISNDMTYGHKVDMFVLDLSFIGWFLLGALPGIVFGAFSSMMPSAAAIALGSLAGLIMFFTMGAVMTYYNATRAELYGVLRQIALERGICRIEELAWDQPQVFEEVPYQGADQQ
ncbi:MAG: DUF975 family protein [Clostridiales bacterium]|nr:DUF975 family protein [Clostridiales bacterium]